MYLDAPKLWDGKMAIFGKICLLELNLWKKHFRFCLFSFDKWIKVYYPIFSAPICMCILCDSIVWVQKSPYVHTILAKNGSTHAAS